MVTLTSDEQTITSPANTDLQVDGIESFQNMGINTLRWSTIAFSAENQGALIKAGGERVMSGPTTIYFKGSPQPIRLLCRKKPL